MKVTYTSPNSSHHYYYANGFSRHGCLHAFISGWPRFAPSKPQLSPDSKLIKRDLFMSIYALGFGRIGLTDHLFRLTNLDLDLASYRYAIESQIFLFYRTTGLNTSKRLKKEHFKTVCVMEEVNSHLLNVHNLLLEEYLRLGLDPSLCKLPYDANARLEAYESSDFILCPSIFAKRSFIQYGIPESKIILNNYGMPRVTKLFNEVALPASTVFRILYVGQINIRKGLRYLLEAYSQFKCANKELIIVGPNTEITGLENMAIPDGVHFKGVLKGAELKAMYESATVFVLPSLEDGFGLVLGEAMANGLPIIATTNTGAEDIISHASEGFIVSPCDTAGILDALQKLADSPDTLANMRKNCYNKASSLASWDVSCDSLFFKLSSLLPREKELSL